MNGRRREHGTGGDPLEALKKVVSSSPGDRQAAIDEYLLAAKRVCKSIGFDLCNQFKADRNTWSDDFVQIAWMEAHALMQECLRKPDLVDQIHNFRPFLKNRAKSKVTAFVDSAAGFNQASGMTGVKRRIREMEKTRATLRSLLQREPTDEEIVDKTNERMRDTRKDYKRQGMECSVEDLHVSDTAESIDELPHHPSAVTDDDGDLHATEKARLVMMILAACDEQDESLGQIARIWLKDALRPEFDKPPTAAEIAHDLGISPSSARNKVAQVRTIARKVAMERFSIRREANSDAVVDAAADAEHTSVPSPAR